MLGIKLMPIEKGGLNACRKAIREHQNTLDTYKEPVIDISAKSLLETEPEYEKEYKNRPSDKKL